jgi:hypothetical protein
MDLELQIVAVGDTTSREISDASEELRTLLERLAGVDEVSAQSAQAPDKAKGLGAALGGLALKVAPAAFHAVMRTLKTALTPHPPTKVVVQTKGAKFRFEFDPKTISLEELVAAADRLRAAAPRP